MLLPSASDHSSAASGHTEGVAEMMNSAIVASGHVSSSASGRLLMLAAVLDCPSDASGPYKGRVRSPLPCLFLHCLASGLVPIFVLGLCLISWVFSCASRVLLMVLIIGSSCCLRPSQSCILLNYKTITCKFISPIWL